jgi:hypothetical protein
MDGFFLASGDGAYQLNLGATSRSTVVPSWTTVPTSTVVIRRALDLRGTIARRFNFDMPDLQAATSLRTRADADFAPWLELRAGKFKTPFGIGAGLPRIRPSSSALTNTTPNGHRREPGKQRLRGRLSTAHGISGPPDNERQW